MKEIDIGFGKYEDRQYYIIVYCNKRLVFSFFRVSKRVLHNKYRIM